MRRVLHLRSSNGFFGAERVLTTLLPRLDKYNVHAYMLVLEDYITQNSELYDVAIKYHLRVNLIKCKRKLDLKSLFEIIKFAKNNNIEVIHTHDIKSNIYGWITAKFLRVPIINTLHGWTSHTNKMKLYERIDKLLLKSFNAVVLVAPPVNNAIKRKNNYKNEVYIPNGVDIDIFNQTKKGLGKKYWGIKPECFVFGIFARFTKEKGHELLLRAFAKSCYKNDEIKLLMFGEGPEYNNIQKIIIEYGLTQNVKVLPPNDNIDHVIHDIDCYVSASFTEGMPMVLLEAMASGIPIIATNVGAVNTLLEKGAGYLVEPGNLDALAASLLNVLDNASDLKCTSKLALDRVRQNYSADIQAERYSELYNKVCIVRH